MSKAENYKDLLAIMDWQDPCYILYLLANQFDHISLLLSSEVSIYKSGYSWLLVEKSSEIIGGEIDGLDQILGEKQYTSDDFGDLPSYLAEVAAKVQNIMFGYLSYDLKNKIELILPEEQEVINEFADYNIVSYQHVIVFDHEREKTYIFSGSSQNQNAIMDCFNFNHTQHAQYQKELSDLEDKRLVNSFHSNMNHASYINKLNLIRDHIRVGDIYQANLTRKFFGELSYKANKPLLFAKLYQINPASYFTFVKMNGDYIISSSPEKFITIDPTGQIETCPIKGTAPRFKNDPDADEKSRQYLINSTKEQAENLMIVDLMRNDLSRVSQQSSVKVDRLFEISSYDNVYHMSSTIRSLWDKKYSFSDVVKAIFPPGSMTGAPKLKAITICSELEIFKRQIYAGILFCCFGDHSVDSAVVIRTIAIKDESNYEFQLGGAITYDSDPEMEYQESLQKGKSIFKLLNINEKDLDRVSIDGAPDPT